MPGAEVLFLWKTFEPVQSDRGLTILPTARFEDCTELDVICVPGGPGQVELMDHQETLRFLRRIAPRCKLITSVCTGSLVLGAAGLLTGFRATCHWNSIHQLRLLAAEPVSERVVRGRNRLTGAGVTSGIDLALTVVAELTRADVAQEIQLQLEYDPEPPYRCESPRTASQALVNTTREKLAPFIARRRAATERAAQQLAKISLHSAGRATPSS